MEELSESIVDIVARRKKALTVPELAQILSVSSRTLYEMCTDGRMPCLRIGSTIRLDPKTTAAWLAQRAV